MSKNQILVVAVLLIAIAYLARIYPDQTTAVLWSVLVGAALQWAYRQDGDTNTRT